MRPRSADGWREALRDFLDQISTGAVPLLHFFDRTNSPAKIGNFYKFLLDSFQPLMPLTVSNLSLRIVSAAPSILVVQLLQLCDLGAEFGDLFTKHFQMVHNNEDSIWRQLSAESVHKVITSVRCAKEL